MAHRFRVRAGWFVGLFLVGPLLAQTDPYLTPPPATPAPPVAASPSVANSAPAPAASQDSQTAEAPAAQDSDFLLEGVPYAKVLALTGTVEIKPPGETAFRALALDEPIALGSVIHTGFFSTVDLATAVGMAVRLTPRTVVVVQALPDGEIGVASRAGAPPPAQLNLKHGTIISALGRDDGQPINFQIATPQGVAAARGTMFAVSSYQGGSEVNMLHGTVNFETPDHQTSQVEAGDSQEITGDGVGSRFSLGQRKTFSAEKGERLFRPSSALLEHANGYGIVRRGLGEDTVNALEKRGFHFSPEARQRFLNARHQRYERRTFNARARPRSAETQPRREEENRNPATTQDRTTPRFNPNDQNQDPFPEERQRRKRDF